MAIAKAKSSNLVTSSGSITTSNTRHPFQVHIEGNIASGKTTLIQSLEGNSDFSLQYEPIEEWTYTNEREGTPNLLLGFYEDPIAFGASFQRLVLATYYAMHDTECTAPIKIFDRSLHSSQIFRDILLEDGYISEPTHEELHMYYETLASSCSCDADLVIYLKTNPSQCFQRVIDRKRPEEKRVTQAYLTRLHLAQEDWMTQNPFSMVTIDGALPPQEIRDRAIRAIYRRFSETRIRALTAPYESTSQEKNFEINF